MKTYSPEQDISRLLLRGEIEPKRTKLISRVVKYAIEGDHEKRVDRVEEVCLVIERIVTRDERAKTIAAEIIRAISLELMEHDGVDVFIDIVGNRLESTGISRTDPLSNAKSLLTRAANRFCSRFSHTIGESSELSIRFALALIEIAQDAMQEMVTARQQKKAFEMPPQRQTVTNFVLNSFLTPPCEAIHSKAWVERLIEAVGHNSIASEVLHSIFTMVTFPIRLAIETFKTTLSVEEALQISDDNMKIYSNENRQYLLICALKPKHANLLYKWTDANAQKSLLQKQKGEELIAWFEANRDEIDRVTRERHQAISEHPRHGLRPFGFDRINIRTSVLWNAGYRHIVFHPENHMFPDTDIDFGIVQVRPHITSYRGTHTNLRMLTVDKSIFECEVHPVNAVHKILEFILIDILYRIIAAPSSKRIFGTDKNPDEDNKSGPTLEVSVRPFIRRLPMGQDASQSARTFGEEYFKMQLPTGVTFIRAHYRGGEISFDNMPVGPIMTYTDEHCYQLT